MRHGQSREDYWKEYQIQAQKFEDELMAVKMELETSTGQRNAATKGFSCYRDLTVRCQNLEERMMMLNTLLADHYKQPLLDRTSHLKSVFCVPLTFSRREIQLAADAMRQEGEWEELSTPAQVASKVEWFVQCASRVFVEQTERREECPFSSHAPAVIQGLFYRIVHQRAVTALDHLIEIIVHEMKNCTVNDASTPVDLFQKNRDQVMLDIGQDIMSDPQHKFQVKHQAFTMNQVRTLVLE